MKLVKLFLLCDYPGEVPADWWGTIVLEDGVTEYQLGSLLDPKEQLTPEWAELVKFEAWLVEQGATPGEEVYLQHW